jgi:hypothetical protein
VRLLGTVTGVITTERTVDKPVDPSSPTVVQEFESQRTLPLRGEGKTLAALDTLTFRTTEAGCRRFVPPAPR